jgi:hypothetical protein
MVLVYRLTQISEEFHGHRMATVVVARPEIEAYEYVFMGARAPAAPTLPPTQSQAPQLPLAQPTPPATIAPNSGGGEHNAAESDNTKACSAAACLWGDRGGSAPL